MSMLNEMASTFRKLGCNIVAVISESPEDSTFDQHDEKNNITLVADPTNTFGAALNLTHNAKEEMIKIYKDLGIYNDNKTLEGGLFEPMDTNVPATFIIDKGEEGRIYYKHAKRDFTNRAPASTIIQELSQINEKVLQS
jgi:peroxiredoxin